jgi:hypothetical protein
MNRAYAFLEDLQRQLRASLDSSIDGVCADDGSGGLSMC